MASTPQARLLAFLRQRAPTPGAKVMFKRALQEFVLEYGWWYAPSELPRQIARGTPQECFKNAAYLTIDDDSLIYCERYALFRNVSVPRLHAWVTDGRGRAIDNTWPKCGVDTVGTSLSSFHLLRQHKISC